jgi:hypothetical protein
MEQKAWIDVKILSFFIRNAIQYIGVIGYGMKPVLSPTDLQFLTDCKSYDI